MIFLYPKVFKKSKKVSILENGRKGFVTLSDHCVVEGLFNKQSRIYKVFFQIGPFLQLTLNSTNEIKVERDYEGSGGYFQQKFRIWLHFLNRFFSTAHS